MEARPRHRLRIAVKKLRYAREFFESLKLDGRGRRASGKIDGALENLQGALGSLNDTTMHVRLAHGLARINLATRKAYAIGFVTGQEHARSRQLVSEAIQAGKRMRRAI
jgi:CHAD domain-containing protein